MLISGVHKVFPNFQYKYIYIFNLIQWFLLEDSLEQSIWNFSNPLYSLLLFQCILMQAKTGMLDNLLEIEVMYNLL